MTDKLRPPLYAIAALLLYLRGYPEVALLFVWLAILFAVVFYLPSKTENQ